MDIDEQLSKSITGFLYDGVKVAAIVFPSGVGNGIFFWEELRAGRRVVGYRIDFTRD